MHTMSLPNYMHTMSLSNCMHTMTFSNVNASFILQNVQIIETNLGNLARKKYAEKVNNYLTKLKKHQKIRNT